MTKCIKVDDFKSVKTNSKASFPAVDRGQFIQCIVDNMKMRMMNENDVNLQLIRQIDSVFSVYDDIRQGERET